MAQENKSWGYDRIAGSLANLGHQLSDQTIGNILKRYGIAPAPKRSQSTNWKDFIATHMAVLAGTDFFTAEVLTWRGLVTYYVLFFLHLESRRTTLAGITRHPTETWMSQMARNAVDEPAGAVRQCRYLLHDRDAKFCVAFQDVFAAEGTRYSSPPQLRLQLAGTSAVESVLVASFDTTAGPLEYFDSTGMKLVQNSNWIARGPHEPRDAVPVYSRRRTTT
jgi:hypothetical protein